jgi:ATP-dependent helicase/DNAse subunit B
VKNIDSGLTGRSALVRRKLTGLDESNWREFIERLAEDFVNGRADVDPRDYPKTCDRCGLQSVCRVQEPENRARVEDENTGEDDDEG